MIYLQIGLGLIGASLFSAYGCLNLTFRCLRAANFSRDSCRQIGFSLRGSAYLCVENLLYGRLGVGGSLRLGAYARLQVVLTRSCLVHNVAEEILQHADRIGLSRSLRVQIICDGGLFVFFKFKFAYKKIV